jgi:hypothetical protein
LLGKNIKDSKSGIIVANCQKKIISFNIKSISMCDFPQNIILSQDGELALRLINRRIIDPTNFLEFVSLLYRRPNLVMHKIFKLNNEKTLLISSEPQYLDVDIVGRIWNFRQLNPIDNLKE